MNTKKRERRRDTENERQRETDINWETKTETERDKTERRKKEPAIIIIIIKTTAINLTLITCRNQHYPTPTFSIPLACILATISTVKKKVMARSEQNVMYLRLGYSSLDLGVLAETDTSDTSEQILSSHRIHRCREGVGVSGIVVIVWMLDFCLLCCHFVMRELPVLNL